MATLDYWVILLYFISLVLISFIVGRRIHSSSELFLAGRNSSWWLSGVSSYMSIFSASTFVIWGGVAFKSGLVAPMTGWMFTISSLVVGRFIAGRWHRLRISSPGEFITLRFGKATVNFYTVIGILSRGAHTAVSIYAVSVILCALVEVPRESILSSTGYPGDSMEGHLCIWWAMAVLGLVTIIYTILGGFVAILMTDVIQFGVLLTVVIFMVPLSLNHIGGIEVFLSKAGEIPGFFSGVSETYNWTWMALWVLLNIAFIGGDWPFVQRYISVPTERDSRRSAYLIGFLYLITPLIWYFPSMAYRVIEPGDPENLQLMAQLGENAYVNMGKAVLMTGMLGMMMAAMLSATMSNVSGTLNVYANVFTMDIWGALHPTATERQRIRCARIFTLCFGLAITLCALLIPLAGGAEKVVVAVLTMVLCPLFIPSLWGLFSKNITGRQLIVSMALTWTSGFLLRFVFPPQGIPSSLVESLSGCILPLVLLASFECLNRKRGTSSARANIIEAHKNQIITPSEQAKAASREYSLMAISCFALTITAIALLLALLLVFKDQRALDQKQTVLWTILAIALFDLGYILYRMKSVKSKATNHEA